LVEYKREAYQLFTELINAINDSIATTLFKIEHVHTPEQSPMARRTFIESAPAKTMSDETADSTSKKQLPQSKATRDPRVENVGRNDACPCGSGKKFKKCYLASDPDCKLLNK
jgi:preprotein translocase subunit SecA